MNKNDFVLSVLSTSNGDSYTPVQVQKLFFLIDKKLPELVNGPYFNFEPYDYGPFDVDVYKVLEELSLEGKLEIHTDSQLKRYKLTPNGQEKGEFLFNSLESKTRENIKKFSDFVRSLSFAELVSVIYKAYPEMKINSVFRG